MASTRQRDRRDRPARTRKLQLTLERAESRLLLSGYPPGDLTEGNAAAWGTFAADGASRSVADDTTRVRVGSSSLRFDTASGFDTGVSYPAVASDHWDLTPVDELTISAFGVNANNGGWQGNQPIVVLKGPAGSITYTPTAPVMPNGSWATLHIPLAGSADWTRTASGSPTLADMTQIEIHQDTWGGGFTVYYDGVQFVHWTITQPPTGDMAEGNAAAWGTFAADGATTSVTDDATLVHAGSSALRFDTASGYDTGVAYPTDPTIHWDLTGQTELTFWAFGDNQTTFGWQGAQPVVVLEGPFGRFTYTPDDSIGMSNGRWQKYHVPLAGDAHWIRTATGSPSLADVSQLQIHQDTWDSGFNVTYDGVQFTDRDLDAPPPAGPTPPPGVDPDAIAPRVLLYAFDPIMENLGGVRQHQAYGWSDPVALTQQIVSDFRASSHGKVDFQVVDTEVVDEHPYFADGFQNTDESFVTNWAARDFHSSSSFDYLRFCRENNIAARIDSGDIDEVWIYSGPISGMFESVMAGPGAYWINGPTQAVPSDRAFAIMGWNFERGVGEAIHSFGHRAEGNMDHIYGTQAPNLDTNWDKFTFQDRYQAGLGGIGSVHFPVNGQSDYDYANSTYVVSNADDWANYPNFTGATRSINFREWSPDGADPQRQYLDWWYGHMPHFAGRGPDGRLNNWWRYLTDLDQFKAGPIDLHGTDGLPTVRTLAPSDGQAVAGAVTVRADAWVDGALGRVDLYVDGAYYASDTIAPYTFTWDTSGLSGAHTLQTRAYELQSGTEGVSTPLTVDVAPFRVRMLGASANGHTSLSLSYEVAGASAPPFSIDLSRSADEVAGGDVLLATLSIFNPADLTPGVHTKHWTIGAGSSQVPLPGLGAAEVDGDYAILAVASPAVASPGDALAILIGAYHPVGGPVFALGTPGADVINASQGTTLKLVVNGTSYSYQIDDVTEFRIRGGSGADAIRGAGLARPMHLWGGAGDDTLQGGSTGDTIAGGAGADEWFVAGTTGADVIAIAKDKVAGQLKSTRGADVDRFLFDASDRVHVVGDLGNDKLTVASNVTLPAVLEGGGGNDKLSGGAGNDTLDGGDGNDTLTGGSGGDALIGGPGLDRLVESADVNFVLSDSSLTGLGGDSLSGIESATLTGGAGKNLIDASAFTGSSSLVGGAGDDTLRGGPGNDTITGGLGNDSLDGQAGSDRLIESGDVNFTLTDTSLAGLGADQLAGFESARLTGGAGNNRLDASAFAGKATLVGGSGDDTLVGGAGNDSLDGGLGDDVLTGGPGNDTLNGNAGNDRLVESGDVNFTLTNTALTGVGTDKVAGIEQASLTGGAGDNQLNASSFTLGPVTLNGGSGRDTLRGGSGADALNGGSGNDILVGRSGDDTLDGGGGHDLLIGGAGADSLVGGLGHDLLIDAATSLDANLAALDAILAEWTSADSYPIRTDKLRAGAIPGGYRLDATTILNDGAADVLTGGSDRDWYITHSTDIVTDQASDEDRDVL